VRLEHGGDMDSQLRGPLRVLEQLCNTAAVLETGMPDDILKQLVLLHLTLDLDGGSTTIEGLRVGLRENYELSPLPDDLRQAVDHLQEAGELTVNQGGMIAVVSKTSARIRGECDSGRELEHRVKAEWLGALSASHPDIPGELLWSALEEFIQSAFARHGMQTALLIDPAFETDQDHEISLSALQTQAVGKYLPEELRDSAVSLIAEFLAGVGESSDRVRYIGRLADTAHAFFIMHVSPEVAHTMREGLSPITVFLDTNFLFAFIGLHSDPYREVADRLVEAVSKHKLPIKLRYHEATARELSGTLDYYKRTLGSHRWSQALSRAAISTNSVSGVEYEYHRRNAKTPTDVAVFFRPFEHYDVILSDKGIEIYRGSDKGADSADAIAADYERELARDKPPSAIEHDAKVLATVRALRSEAHSSLEAGSLLVTCDYTLYRYDQRAARKGNTPVSVLLPNMLWQILRSFVPTTKEYDQAFADTFALAEFRTIRSTSGKAASKMLSYLATFGDLPEETAAKMLSNDVVLGQLSAADSDGEIASIMDSELVRLNQQLVEESAALAAQVQDSTARQSELEKESKRLREEAAANERVAAERTEEAVRAIEAARDADQARQAAKEEAKQGALEHDKQMKRLWAAERERARQAHVAAALVAALVLAIHLILWLGVGWPQWLVSHDRALAMELLILAGVVAGAIAIFEAGWRRYLIGTGLVFALVIAVLSQL